MYNLLGGNKRREAWYTNEIDVNAKNPNRNVKCEFQIDALGKDFKAIATDANGLRRIRMYYKDAASKDKSEIGSADGKGVTKNSNGKWVQDVIALPGANEFDKNNYYYDEETGKFLNAEGQEAPKSILTNFGLMEVLETARGQVTDRFRAGNKPNHAPEKLDDDGLSL